MSYGPCYVLLYYSEGCNICGMVLRECYINDWHTTTCSGMQGHHRFILVFVSNNLGSLNLVSRGNTSHASKILEPTTMPFVSTIPTYYMVFLRHSKVNCSCATFKQFKSYYLLFVSMFYSS